MKERPILFSATMVRAILDGRKTQTRRVAPIESLDIRQIGDQMVAWNVDFSKAIKGVLGTHSGGKFTDLQARSIIASQFNPYGQPGDRLWVREPWRIVGESPDDALDMFDRDDVQYRADDDQSYIDTYRPSIYMPRWASRITLEITAVRVERLRDISEADAMAEGIERGQDFQGWYRGPLSGDSAGLEQAGRDFKIPTAFPKLAYRALWESINGPTSWDANPWVWVIEFKRAQP